MHNSLNSSKAEFFILTAFAIVTILYFVSKWVQPTTIIDTSRVASRTDLYIFNNIVEKANKTVAISKNCEDLTYNLEEFKDFVESLKGRQSIIFNYTIISCNDVNGGEVKFNITEITPTSKISSNFTSYWKP